ncbi:copper chaperone PCu(A)C [Lysobacter sp. D1-1-M9]|uniref:copper chaperone PCu(A)C n=1 Tax=Novilysobacter longmucuonensis TaxID=3098603 RepID=UPI002FC5A04E
MIRIRRSMALLLVWIAFSALPACGRGCDPAVIDGWVRLPPVAMPMLAGFGRIENECSAQPLIIVGASSPAFAEVSLHETRVADGISRMRAVDELPVAAGQPAMLQPGGLHLMLMQPHVPLRAGERVAIEFQLKDGGTLRGEFEVRGPGG